MKKIIQHTILLVSVLFSSYTFAQDAEYRVVIDADPLIKQINGRDLSGEAQVRVVLTGREDQVIGGKLANGIIPSITIDEEPDIGKVIGVEITLNGIGWTKSVTIRNVKVYKTVGDKSRTYDFPCGCPLTQGNQSVYMDAGGALEFVADSEVIRSEEMEEFEFEGEFSNDDVRAKNFTISKRTTPTKAVKKGPEKELSKSKTRICTTQEYNASASFDINFLTNPTQNAIYPGALIYAEDLANGSYNNIKSGKDRAPLEISTSSAVIGIPALTVENPSLSRVRTAMNDIMINQDRGELDVQANFEIFEVSSKEELSLAMGGHFESANVTANVSFNYDTNSEKTLKVVKFAQIYYTMDIDQPSSPEDVFTNPKDAIEVLNTGKTPLYVSQVTFGRIAYFFMETTFDSETIGAHVDGEYRSVFTAGGEVDLSKSMEKGETKISALIVGGDGDGGITAVNGYEGFLSMLESGGTLNKKSLGVPVSYTLRFLSDGTIARTNLATSYTKRTCREVNDPMQNVIMTIHKITSDGEYDMHGSFTSSISSKTGPRIPGINKTLFSDANPGKLGDDKTVEVNAKSQPIKIDTRKIDQYNVNLNFYVEEHDPYVFNESDANTKNETVRLKDILAVDKQAITTDAGRHKVSVIVDQHTYYLEYSIYLD